MLVWCYLMTSPSRDEDGVPTALDHGVALHSILRVKPSPQSGIEVGALVVDWVVMRIQSLPVLYGHLGEEVSDLVGVPGVVDVPQGSRQLPLLPDSVLHAEVAARLVNLLQDHSDVLLLAGITGDAHVDQQIDSVAHVEVKVGAGFTGVQGVTVGDVHFRTQLRSEVTVRNVGGEVTIPFSQSVLLDWKVMDQVMISLGDKLCYVILCWPVLQFQQHWPSTAVLQSAGNILEPFPEPLERLVGNSLASQSVDEVRLEVTKVLAEGPGVPEVEVEILLAVADQDRLASSPLGLEQLEVVRRDGVLQLEETSVTQPAVAGRRNLLALLLGENVPGRQDSQSSLLVLARLGELLLRLEETLYEAQQ